MRRQPSTITQILSSIATKPHTLSKGGPVQGQDQDQDQIDVTISGFASRVSRDLKTHVGKGD